MSITTFKTTIEGNHVNSKERPEKHYSDKPTSLDSSELHVLVVMILSVGTQC